MESRSHKWQVRSKSTWLSCYLVPLRSAPAHVTIQTFSGVHTHFTGRWWKKYRGCIMQFARTHTASVHDYTLFSTIRGRQQACSQLPGVDVLLSRYMIVFALRWGGVQVLGKRLGAGAVRRDPHGRPAGRWLCPALLLCCEIDDCGHHGLRSASSVYAHLKIDVINTSIKERCGRRTQLVE